MTAKIKLSKDVQRRTIQTKWYELCWNNKSLKFRSDFFVPEEIENELVDLHAKPISKKELLDGCTKILQPYLSTIVEKAEEYLTADVMVKFGIKHFQPTFKR